MYKSVMEQIILLDKLEVLAEDKVEFEIELHPKDLRKLNKKDEMVRQRVYIEP